MKHSTLSASEVVDLVARAHGFAPDEIRSPNRRATLCQARHMAAFMAYRWCGKSLKQIGNVLGGRDHKTVWRSIRRAEAMIAEDPDFFKAWKPLDNQCAMALGRPAPAVQRAITTKG